MRGRGAGPFPFQWPFLNERVVRFAVLSWRSEYRSNSIVETIRLATDISRPIRSCVRNCAAALSCTIDQLAAYVKNSLTSGAFRLRLSNASTFGLTENERGEVRLTPLGRSIADPSQEAAARADAFLAVPLYERIYDNYKGFTLPSPSALEKFMREVGVSSKQTGKARNAFMRSARQAGFFAHGEDRLVRPADPGTKPIESPKAELERDRTEKKNGNRGAAEAIIQILTRSFVVFWRGFLSRERRGLKLSASFGCNCSKAVSS